MGKFWANQISSLFISLFNDYKEKIVPISVVKWRNTSICPLVVLRIPIFCNFYVLRFCCREKETGLREMMFLDFGSIEPIPEIFS